MSTHGTELWLEIEESPGRPHAARAWIDVASDVAIDRCVRLSVDEGDPGGDESKEIHLNPDQAEDVANHILAIVRRHRELGNDPSWAAGRSSGRATSRS